MQRRAKLGDIEFTVIESEEVDDTVDITDSAVENGQDVSDHVKQSASIISITGVMTGDDASDKLNQLKRHQLDGDLMTYIGRNWYNDMAIQKFNRNHGKRIKNGFEFSMTLKQVRIAVAKEVSLNVASPPQAPPGARTVAMFNIREESTLEDDISVKKVITKIKPKTNKGVQQAREKPVVTSSQPKKREYPSPQGQVPSVEPKPNPKNSVDELKAIASRYKVVI